jgi:hypothetical protein
MMEGPGADSEEKRALASDLDTVMVDSLKALDLSRPIREADMTSPVFSSAKLRLPFATTAIKLCRRTPTRKDR